MEAHSSSNWELQALGVGRMRSQKALLIPTDVAYFGSYFFNLRVRIVQ